MKTTRVMACMLALGIWIQPAFAGKVEDVQAAIKKACSKDVANADALRLVKVLYLNCVPGQKVDADGCNVDCLKENTGAVVGQ